MKSLKLTESAVSLETQMAEEVLPPDAPESERLAGMTQAGREDVAALAYQYWQERGCPTGSPDQDWFRAESALNEQP